MQAVDDAAREIQATIEAQRAASDEQRHGTLSAAAERLVEISERRTALRMDVEIAVRAVLTAGRGKHRPGRDGDRQPEHERRALKRTSAARWWALGDPAVPARREQPGELQRSTHA